jgi:hypothetical protein
MNSLRLVDRRRLTLVDLTAAFADAIASPEVDVR